MVVLQRSPTMGFGFVAGSERPVIVRFVTEDGPSMNKLQPGDHILAVNGEDVTDAPRDRVIQLVRACDAQVTLSVCQPVPSRTPGRKSTLLSAGKKAKLKTRPSRVRFAESVCVNGAPLFPVDTLISLFNSWRHCIVRSLQFSVVYSFSHLLSRWVIFAFRQWQMF